VTFTENIWKELRPHQTDKQFLFAMRVVVLIFTVIVTTFAMNTESSIFKMVENAYKITLVAAFVPLAFGLYWKRATTQGALAAIVGGLSIWVLLEVFANDGLWPPQLAGLLASLTGMVVGSLMPQLSSRQAVVSQ
jgi:Na+/proline symporter